MSTYELLPDDERHPRVKWELVDDDMLPFVDQSGGYLSLYFAGDVEGDVDSVCDPEMMERAVAAGFWVEVANRRKDPGGFSLRFLEPIIEALPFLRVDSICPLRDIEVLERAHALEGLHLSGPRSRERADLSRLPNLKRYVGTTHACVRSVFANPNLRWVDIDGPPPPGGLEIVAPLNFLRINLASKWIDPPRLVRAEALEGFWVSDMKEVDLGKFLPYSGLRQLEVHDCKNLRGLSALSEFPALDSFTARLVTCEEDWSQILQIGASTVNVLTEPAPLAR